jgi:hypothetical protein
MYRGDSGGARSASHVPARKPQLVAQAGSLFPVQCPDPTKRTKLAPDIFSDRGERLVFSQLAPQAEVSAGHRLSLFR